MLFTTWYPFHSSARSVSSVHLLVHSIRVVVVQVLDTDLQIRAPLALVDRVVEQVNVGVK